VAQLQQAFGSSLTRFCVFAISLTMSKQAFENTSTSVAASQMRNALNNLCDEVTDPAEKQVSLLRFEPWRVSSI
jgi:hypothetical protein